MFWIVTFQATSTVKVHEPCGYAYKVVVSPDFEEYYDTPVVVHRDSGSGGVADSFILSLYEEAERLAPIIECEEEMKELTPEQEQAHTSATVCWLCLELFEDKTKVHDHCHYSWV